MKIYYLLAEFPSATEYFIANEITELTNRGVDIRIMSINRGVACRDGKRVSLNVIYYKPYSYHALMAHVNCLLSHTKPYLSVLSTTVRKLFFSPVTAAKRIKNLHYAAYFIYQMKGSGKRHIHAHFAGLPATVASVMSEVTSLPYSISAHAHDIYVADECLNNKLNSAKFVVTCTQANKKYLDKLTKKEHVYHVYHGIDIEKWVYKPRNYSSTLKKVKILAAGRLVEKKGLVYLLKALAILNPKLDFECSIVGAGPEEQNLRNSIEYLSLEGKVKMLGAKPQNELLKLYHDHDIFVLPCIISNNGDRDGLPNVLVEALATGLPIISTNISAIEELIVNGENGVLVPEKNEQILANAIENLCLTPAKMNEVSRNGRITVEKHFRINHCTEQLYTLFEREIK